MFIKKNSKIYSVIIKQYVLFAFLTIFVFIVGVTYTLFSIGKMLYDNRYFDNIDDYLEASKIVKSDYKNIDGSKITSLGGWIEILNENKNVVYVIGDKKDTDEKYTEDKFLNLLNDNLTVAKNLDKKYISTITPFSYENKKYYCMIKMPSKVIHVEVEKVDDDEFYVKKACEKVAKGTIEIIIFILIIILLYGLWTSRKIAVPLKRIFTGIKKMSDGDYSVRIDFESSNEFVEIKDAFNFMAAKIQSSELEREKVERLKQHMFVDISHDLKTPIASIQGYSKALYDGVVQNDEKKQRYLKIIYDKSLRLTTLVEHIHQLAKINNDSYKLNKEKIDICEFLREIVVEFYPQIEERNFQFIIDIPEEVINYDFDKVEMSRVISNIITNSLKYNEDGTTLKIALKKNEYIEIIIADNGVGIEEDLKEEIFEAFTRGDLSRNTTGGTGLGLSISKKIIEKHGGKLELQCSEEFKTIFKITLK